MLEQLLIFTRGGLILWTCSEVGNALKGSPIDTLIRSCLLEERSGAALYNYDAPGAAYTLKWTFHNELNLVFVAVYQKIFHLLYVDDLLAMVKREFSEIYDPKKMVYNDFDEKFRQLRKEAEARVEDMKKSNQVAKPVSNNNLSKKQGKVQKIGLTGGDHKKNTSDSGSDGGDGEKTKGRKSENGNGLANGNRDGYGKSTAKGSTNGKENESSNNGAFDVNKLQKLRAQGSKKTNAVVNKVPKVDPKKKITKKNRVWDEAPVESKLDFTDPVNGDENVVVVAANEGESMMDKEEILSSDSDSDDSEDEDKEDGKTDKKPDAKRKGWFSSMFQR